MIVLQHFGCKGFEYKGSSRFPIEMLIHETEFIYEFNKYLLNSGCDTVSLYYDNISPKADLKLSLKSFCNALYEIVDPVLAYQSGAEVLRFPLISSSPEISINISGKLTGLIPNYPEEIIKLCKHFSIDNFIFSCWIDRYLHFNPEEIIKFETIPMYIGGHSRVINSVISNNFETLSETYNLQIIFIAEDSSTNVPYKYSLVNSLSVTGGKLLITSDVPKDKEGSIEGNISELVGLLFNAHRLNISINSITFEGIDYNVIVEGDVEKLK